ncbi:LamG-like jellyroll fold domain-containing protein [Antarcticirhabdus aurantiaca]|uniref:Uncharacterized protein n=1 Tax=Antarcticirhabdus aurantiaca TaxID=2606717 RepID=A0ACD4NQY6_9HYPH|nr:hypothetical protein OXU80_03615 [Jeongeuplla avenae]
MAETDLTPEEAAADAAIPLYNGAAYDPVTNPGGFEEDGHTVNFIPLTNHVRVIARMVRRLALFALAKAEQTTADKEATAADRVVTGEDRAAAAGSAGDALAQANRAMSAVGQIVSDLDNDPVNRSSVPASLDIFFNEGFKPPRLNVARAVVGTRINRFGASVATPVDALRHQYDAAGRYLGVEVKADDRLSIPVSAEWFNSAEFTLFVEAMVGTESNDRQLISLTDGTSSNRLNVFRRSGAPRQLSLAAMTGGQSVISTTFATMPLTVDGQLIRMAFSTNRTGSRIALNGVSAAQAHTSGRSIASPTFDRMELGNLLQSTAAFWGGQIRQVAVIPRYLDLTSIENMTRLAA